MAIAIANLNSLHYKCSIDAHLLAKYLFILETIDYF